MQTGLKYGAMVAVLASMTALGWTAGRSQRAPVAGVTFGNAELKAELKALSRKLDEQASHRAGAAAGVDPVALRVMIRDAVTVAVKEAASARQDPAEAEPEGTDALLAEAVPVSPTNDEAAARAYGLIDEALKEKVWSAEYATDLRGLLGQVSPSEAALLRSKLAVAINNGQLRLKPGVMFL